MALGKSTGQCEDGVHIVGGCSGAEFRLGETDSHGLEVGRNNEAAGARQHAQAGFVDELHANVGHALKQGCLVERLGNGCRVGPRTGIVGMSGGEQVAPSPTCCEL